MMGAKDHVSTVRSLLEPRWHAAWKEPRYFYRTRSINRPFTVDQSKAIHTGATHLHLGGVDATFAHDAVTINGNTFDLLRGMVEAEDVIVSAGHSSAHIDVDAVLTELWLVTDIEPCRWSIVLTKHGELDVTIAPSAAYVAAEIRSRPVSDHVSIGQWLERYDVNASRDQLELIFGPPARLLPSGAGGGSDCSVLDAFTGAVCVHLHGAKKRRINATGTMSVAEVLAMAPECAWYLHGVRLLPFKDCPLWRCCAHSSTELHLYSACPPGAYTTYETLAGCVRLPALPVVPLPYVPYPTPSGNMFGNASPPRANEIARCAPHLLTREWCIACNAGERTIVFDHAVSLVQVLSRRYGRDQCMAVIGSLMASGQAAILDARMASGIPKVAVRSNYGRWLQCLGDHLYGTRSAMPVFMILAGRSFPLPCSTLWSEVVSLMPFGYTTMVIAPLTDATCIATARPDFMLEELRTHTVHLELMASRKRKR